MTLVFRGGWDHGQSVSSDAERDRLAGLSRQRTASVRMVRRAQALLFVAEGKTDEVIAEQFRMSVT